MKEETLQEMLNEFVEYCSTLSDEEFKAEMEKAKEESPETYKLIMTLLEEQRKADEEYRFSTNADGYAQMPDTLSREELQSLVYLHDDIPENYEPPFIFSLEEIDKIYNDAKNSSNKE